MTSIASFEILGKEKHNNNPIWNTLVEYYKLWEHEVHCSGIQIIANQCAALQNDIIELRNQTAKVVGYG